MDKLLRPAELDVDPNAPESHQVYKHWLCTFEKFLQAVEAARAEGAPETDKYGLLVNYVSSEVYAYIEETIDYQQAITILRRAYVKPKNNIMARHLLSTRLQQPGESLEEFLKQLRQLAKDCNFEAVDAKTYDEQMIRNAFIKGLESNNMRQRILEQEDITLQRAFDLARSLHQAQEHVNQLCHVGNLAATQELTSKEEQTDENSTAASATKNVANKSNWFFCGEPYHSRGRCPAKEAECFNCQKKGHFSRVCRSRKTRRNSASTSDPVLSTVTANLPTCLQTSTVSACVNELPVDALMDTGSSDSYIDASLCKKLDLIVRGNPSTISMASKSYSVKVNGNVNVDLNVFSNQYPDFKSGMMKNLCSDVILGLDFMKLHSKVNFEMNGSKSAISIDNHHLNLCNVLAANIEPPRIFRSI